MYKTIFRILGLIFQGLIKTDNIADKYPISIKGLIRDSGRIILLKNERNEWDFPGGKLENEEGVRYTLIKEIKEELNIEIKVGKPLYIENHLVNNVLVLIIVFECFIISDEPILISHEHYEYKILGTNELDQLDKVQPWVSDCIN